MTKEENYLKHKKETVIRIIDHYNKNHTKKDKCNLVQDRNNFDLDQTFCSSEHCIHCGECCQSFPCVFSPNDFLDIKNIDYMLNILNTGLVCVGFNKAHFIIRPRGLKDKDAFGIQTGAYTTNGNRCLLLGKNGCLLNANYRPSEELLYYLDANQYDHHVLYDEDSYIEDYWEYRDIIYELMGKYKTVFNQSDVTKLLDERIKIIDSFYKDDETIITERAKQLIKAING